MEPSVKGRIEEVATPIARALQVDLVAVECQGKGNGSIVRITIDKPGGVGLHDCEQLHNSVSRALDVADPIPHSYRLEVSSPGLDRPLRGLDDYHRSIGKLIRVTLQKPWRGEWTVVGRVAAVTDQILTVTVDMRSNPQDLQLTWDVIKKSRLEVEW